MPKSMKTIHNKIFYKIVGNFMTNLMIILNFLKFVVNRVIAVPIKTK